MHALPAPPLFLVVRQITPLQLLGAVPFHVQDRHHHQFHPAFDTLESPKTILMEPQRRFQFLEVQLDLPAQSVPLHDLPARQAQVIGHEDFLNLDPLMLVRFLTCREDQLHLAHRVYRLSPGVDIIRPGFHFSAHAARTQSPLGDESSLTGVQPHGYQLIGLQTVDQRSYFAALASGARQHSLRVHRHYPRVPTRGTSLPTTPGLDGRISLHHAFRPFRQRQFPNPPGPRSARSAPGAAVRSERPLPLVPLPCGRGAAKTPRYIGSTEPERSLSVPTASENA